MIKKVPYIWGTDKPYNDYSSYIKKRFENRLQKISTDAGFSCPNRTGEKGRGGCTYCNNDTFKPFYCSPQKTVTQQLQEGIAFFSEKYKTQDYLAYFQSFSNTYDSPDNLEKLYAEALAVKGVKGLVIATRPDCIDEEKLKRLEHLARDYYIVLEYGIESCKDESLKRINRGHDFAETQKAIRMSAGRGIDIGAHLILGLPGESRQTMLQHADLLSELPIDMLKLHQLQIIKGTQMARDYSQNPEDYNLFTAQGYINFVVDFLERLHPRIKAERFISEVPPDMLLAPKWGRLKNFEIVHKIIRALENRNSFQGKLCKQT
jgi:radical SAM protein (TIGR01212 family)